MGVSGRWVEGEGDSSVLQKHRRAGVCGGSGGWVGVRVVVEGEGGGEEADEGMGEEREEGRG